MGLEAFFDKAGVLWDSLSPEARGLYFLTGSAIIVGGIKYLDSVAKGEETIDLSNEYLTPEKIARMRNKCQ